MTKIGKAVAREGVATGPRQGGIANAANTVAYPLDPRAREKDKVKAQQPHESLEAHSFFSSLLKEHGHDYGGGFAAPSSLVRQDRTNREGGGTGGDRFCTGSSAGNGTRSTLIIDSIGASRRRRESAPPPRMASSSSSPGGLALLGGGEGGVGSSSLSSPDSRRLRSDSWIGRGSAVLRANGDRGTIVVSEADA